MDYYYDYFFRFPSFLRLRYMGTYGNNYWYRYYRNRTAFLVLFGRVSDPYLFDPDPDPEFEAGDQSGSESDPDPGL